MFCYETPQFKKKRLLRAEMLEQLRDYPRDYLEIMYAGYSDGVLCGCGLVSVSYTHLTLPTIA